jgi:diguanylate cyclase (GGDEF)-like protein/putative nucleotidyltransferase with HDIG domain
MNWQALPVKLKLYIVLVTAAAIPILTLATLDLLHTSYGNGWIVLTILTVLTVPFFLFLPSVNTIVGIGDAYIIAVAMLFGPTPCILATLCHTLSASISVPNRPKVYLYRIVFNVSSMVCGAWIYSNLYHLLNPSLSTRVADMILPAVVLTVSFFIFNSFSTATAISLASDQKVLRFWIQHYLPLVMDFSVSAVSAVFIVSLSQINLWAPFAAAPLIGVVWGWNKLNHAKTMEAEQHLKDQEALYMRTVESLALAVDAKDQTTYGHIRRVRAYAMGLAKLCGITNEDELKAIQTGSLLHDIGKLAIDDYILNKPGRLSKQEFEKMKLHSTAGDEILRQIQFPFPVAKYVRCHHERWDGAGYPDGLKGEDIPFGARILSIADAFDAIRSSRPYKMSFSVQDSIELLRSASGTLYDPNLVEIFAKNIDQLEALAVEASKDIPVLSFRKDFAKVDQDLSLVKAATPPSLGTAASAELVSLYEFCLSLGKYLDLSDILVILTSRLRRLLPFSTCVFYLDNDDDTLKAAYVSGLFSDVLKDLTMGIGKGISGWVAAYQRPMINTGPALEFQELKGDFTCLTDTLVVPMLSQGHCVGTISLYAQAPTFYSQAHLGLLQSIATHVAPLIEETRRRGKTPRVEDDLVDPVTRTYRASYLSVAGSQMIAAADSNKSPLSLVYIDLKNFSQLEKLYGFTTCDSMLRRAVETLRTEMRETDVLVRFGRQGFVALLAGVNQDQAGRYAQRLEHQIRTTAAGSVAGHDIYFICQTGVACYPNDGLTIFPLLDSAQRLIAERTKPDDSGTGETEKNVVEFPPR